MIDFILQVFIMASFINWDRTEGQVESRAPEPSARQFDKQSEITEVKENETENLRKRYSLPPNKIHPRWLTELDKGKIVCRYQNILQLMC